MVKQCLASLLAASMLAGALGGLSLTAAATDEKEERMELKTWYTAPAADDLTDKDKEAWQKEGTPLGNGFIGGMVYGGVDTDRILINEKTVWSGGPGAGGSKYDSGISDDYTADEIKANLQTLRRRLQDMVTDFTNNKSARLNDNGRVVAQDYGTRKRDNEKIDIVKSQSKDEPVWEDEEMQALIMTLRGEKNFFGSYQMLSDVFITDATGTEYSDYTRALDLRTAVNTVKYKKADGVTYTKEYFINNPSNVVVVRLTADKKGALTRSFSVKTDQPQGKFSFEGDTITMTGRTSDQGAKGLRFAQQLKIIPVGGTMENTGPNKRTPVVTVTGADEILLILSAGTNYQQPMDGSYDFFSQDNPLDAVAARVNAAAEKGYDALLKEHIADYDGLFGRVEFSLDGAAMPKDKTTAQLLLAYKNNEATDAEARYLELLYYQFGRYLLIASSREGSLPANLQGIWADHLDPPWGADYHTNINVQMNYWLAEQTNLSECHTPLLEYTSSLRGYGEKTAKYYYCKQDGSDVRGWTVGHENNIWGNTAPGVWYWGYYFPAAAAWMCQHYWEHYRFTMDKEALAQSFDTMLSAALFWVDNLWTDERDGTLVANPSYSPEHGPYSLGASCDQEVIWELFNEVTEAAEILGITDDQKKAEVAEVKAAMDKLYLPKIGLGGEYLEWKDETKLDINGDNGHRHVNQLYALHPGTLVVAGRSEDDDKAVAAMKKTLTIRGDSGTGWSKAWKINFWARLRDGDHAETMVNQILKQSTFDNLFDFHPPYQIDGNLGATAGMTEMLLQSQGDSIDLLAALPAAWATGSVRGLKARGNFTVDMTWADKALTGATIVANVGGDCTLNYKNLSYATVTRQSDGKEVSLTVVDNDTVTFASEAGETYVVTPGAPAVTYGDVNGDGAVDTADAVLVLQRAAKLIDDTAIHADAADVNGDKTIDTADAVLILQKAAKLIEKFPAEE